MTFIASREQANLELVFKLKKQNKITIPGLLFKESNK
jgi:hypothetical protein